VRNYLAAAQGFVADLHADQVGRHGGQADLDLGPGQPLAQHDGATLVELRQRSTWHEQQQKHRNEQRRCAWLTPTLRSEEAAPARLTPAQGFLPASVCTLSVSR